MARRQVMANQLAGNDGFLIVAPHPGAGTDEIRRRDAVLYNSEDVHLIS